MKAIIVGNWKMNPTTFRQAAALLEATKKAAEKTRTFVIVAPPVIFLRELKKKFRGGRIAYAVQHAHFDERGAHTGDISLAQAKDAGATYVLVGHAERRGLGETNDDTRKKVAAALAHKMTPILCVGEATRGAGGEHFELVKEQLKVGLTDVGATKLGKILLVYEPLWTIGTSATMSPRDMHEMAIFIRKTVVELHGEAGHTVTILYGGSIDETNAQDMLQNGDIRGLLLGRASEDPHKIRTLLQVVAETP